MEGYKVFNNDWTCRDFQYKIGETYILDEALSMCENGFHFCKELKDCFSFYSFYRNLKVAKIEALGTIIYGEHKCCTNKIKIVREIPLEEQLEIMGINKEEYTFFIKICQLCISLKEHASSVGGDCYVSYTSWPSPFFWVLFNASSPCDRYIGGREENGKFKIFICFNNKKEEEVVLTKEKEDNSYNFNKILLSLPKEEKALSFLLENILKEIF